MEALVGTFYNIQGNNKIVKHHLYVCLYEVAAVAVVCSKLLFISDALAQSSCCAKFSNDFQIMDITKIFLDCLIIIKILSGFCILIRGACKDHSFEHLKKLLPVTILNLQHGSTSFRFPAEGGSGREAVSFLATNASMHSFHSHSHHS